MKDTGSPLPKPSSDRRVLDPLERFGEIVFGLIMVLTFTGSLSVATAGRQEIRTMLVGAIGCNVAWGIVDAVMYLLGGLAERGRGLLVLKAIRQAGDAGRVRALIADALPPVLASALRPADFELLRERLATAPDLPAHRLLTKESLRGAAGVFLLVFLSTFPVVTPFLAMSNAVPALRVSNAIAVALLFVAGYAFGRITGRRPVMAGIVMVVFGSVLVGLTIALGG